MAGALKIRNDFNVAENFQKHVNILEVVWLPLLQPVALG